MKKNNVRKGILIGCGVSALLLASFLGSYAYFIGTTTGNKNQEVSVQAGKMELTFADGNPGITKSLEFGSSVEKTFTIENTGSLDAIAKISFEDLVNTYIENSLTYTLSYSETENADYTEIVTNKNVPVSENSSTAELANGLKVPAGAKYYYKLVITLNYLEDTDQTEDLNAMLSTHFKLEEGTKALTTQDIMEHLNLKVAENNTVNFTNRAITDETANGLYSLEDDYGTSYYYRGKVENNYVKFADKYWRIIRINGDGSLRMIYDGTQAYANGTSNTGRLAWQNQEFNLNSNDSKYVGYMYGPAGETVSISKEQAQTNTESSAIKIKLEEWYVNNIKSKGLDQYVADSIFCNDRSTPGKKATGWEYDTGKGNGALSEKIGLITADEIVAAGSGNYQANNGDYYLFKGSPYWSLSPSSSNNTSVYLFIENGDRFYNNDYLTGGGLSGWPISDKDVGVAPVINLTPEYVSTLEGDGTMANPYVSK